MNINDVYQSSSNFLKAEDLKGRRVDVVISKAETQEIGGVNKIVLSFDGKEKQLVCNITNARIIASLFESSETGDWLGREITLRPDKTNFQGDLVDCIRVDSVLPNQPEEELDIPF